MFKKDDARVWSKVLINGAEVEMLWDSGASITVMSENFWKKVGSPKLQDSLITLSGVFSTGAERPLGYSDVIAEWKGKKRKIRVVIAKRICPDFIGGVDTMNAFGIQLKEVATIDSSQINDKYTDKERSKHAMETIKTGNTGRIGRLIKDSSRKYIHGFKIGSRQNDLRCSRY